VEPEKPAVHPKGRSARLPSGLCAWAAGEVAKAGGAAREAVLKHVQERMPYGLFVPDIP
jgi:hypothetical protein